MNINDINKRLYSIERLQNIQGELISENKTAINKLFRSVRFASFIATLFSFIMVLIQLDYI